MLSGSSMPAASAATIEATGSHISFVDSHTTGRASSDEAGSYGDVLLRESWREGTKTRKRTVGNLPACRWSRWS